MKLNSYVPVQNNMSLLKQVNKGPLLNPFEQIYTQSHYHHNKAGERNVMFQFTFDLHITSRQKVT